MSNKTYVISVLIAIFAMLAIFVFPNFLVDPLHYFRPHTQYGYYSSEREFKYQLVTKRPLTGLILGSSKASYIDPPRDTQQPTLIINASFSAALPEEFLFFLKETEPHPHWIAIGLDWYMFNEVKFPFINTADPSDYFQKSYSEKFDYLVSVNIFVKSVRAIFSAVLSRKPLYSGNGARLHRSDERIDRRKICCDYFLAMRHLKKANFMPFVTSRSRITVLEEIQDWANSRGIPLFVWINPSSDVLNRVTDKIFGMEKEFLRDTLAASLINFQDLSNLYPESRWYWNTDPHHYYPSTALLLYQNHISPHLRTISNSD